MVFLNQVKTQIYSTTQCTMHNVRIADIKTKLINVHITYQRQNDPGFLIKLAQLIIFNAIATT